MIGFIVQILGSILGFIGFFSFGKESLIVVGGILILVIDIVGLMTGALRSAGSGILSMVFGAVIFGIIGKLTILQGAMFGLCISNVITNAMGIILLVQGYKAYKDDSCNKGE